MATKVKIKFTKTMQLALAEEMIEDLIEASCEFGKELQNPTKKFVEIESRFSRAADLAYGLLKQIYKK
jgi:phosphate uptake regulator